MALAFPTALGAGAYATGGRGGSVLHVTNLNDSGPGSLRVALTASGTRTIVFDVSGTINLFSGIDVTNGNLTIAGQTSPEGGITISGGRLRFLSADNVIVRYIRVRSRILSSGIPLEQDAVWVLGGTDIIFDHCSVSYSGDEIISMTASDTDRLEDVTLMRSLISSGKTGSIMGTSDYATMTGDVSILKNLWADISHRTSNMGGNGRFDYINNVIFNWGYFASNINMGAPDINVMYNYFKRGNPEVVRTMYFQNTSTVIQVYSAYNYHSDLYLTPEENDWDMYLLTSSHLTPGSGYFSTSPFSFLGPTDNLTAAEAYTDVTGNIGANRYMDNNGAPQTYIDSFDSTKIANTLSGTGGWILPNGETNVGSNWPMPTIPANSRPGGFYVDNAHIAQTWFAANVPLGEDHNNIAPSGYTWLEEYFNQVDGVLVNIPTITLTGPSTINLTVGDTYTELGATATDTEDGSLTGSIVITGTVNTAVAGTYYKYYNVIDSDSNAATQITRTVNVTEEGSPPTVARGKWINRNIFLTLN